jgi:hypothetical protein
VSKRPRSVTAIAALFIVAGAAGLVYHAGEFDTQHPLAGDFLWVSVVRLLAIVGGVFLLLGHAWARWLLLAWMGFHVVLSLWHTPVELALHALLLALVAWVLFRPAAAAFFRGATIAP